MVIAHIPAQPIEAYPYSESAPEGYTPMPEPPRSDGSQLPVIVPQGSSSASKEVSKKTDNRIDGFMWFGIAYWGTAALIGVGALIISSQDNAANDRMPALVRADGFLDSTKGKPLDAGDGSQNSVPSINLQVTPTCTLNNVRFVAVDSLGRVAWNDSIIDVTQYSLTTKSNAGQSEVTNTFRNASDFRSSGLEDKVCT